MDCKVHTTGTNNDVFVHHSHCRHLPYLCFQGRLATSSGTIDILTKTTGNSGGTSRAI